jgi:hypothetical protein
LLPFCLHDVVDEELGEEEPENEEQAEGEEEENTRRISETVPTKIKPIPKYSAFFILSHTNW